jgi:hypothetical protein
MGYYLQHKTTDFYMNKTESGYSALFDNAMPHPRL